MTVLTLIFVILLVLALIKISLRKKRRLQMIKPLIMLSRSMMIYPKTITLFFIFDQPFQNIVGDRTKTTVF